MPRLRVFSGKTLCQLLESHGFRQIRQHGSHVVMQKLEGESTVTVPVPQHKEIRTGTLRSIIRQTRLDRSIFETH